MAAWIRVGWTMRYVAHTAFLGTMSAGCGIAALHIYTVGIEEVPVTARDPVVASEISRRLQPPYLLHRPYADTYEYPVPLQWLPETPDATALSRHTWLCWAFGVQRRLLHMVTRMPEASVSTTVGLRSHDLEPGTNVLGHFDVLEQAADGSSISYRFGSGPDPRSSDGILRFTVGIEDDLAVFGVSTSIWSATTPDFPSWLDIKLHRLYAKVLLKCAVQRMLRPPDERQKFSMDPRQKT